MRSVAVIPAKARSTRVPNKNFREFHEGKSLLEIKIAQCVESGAFQDVYVSSDTSEARSIAEKYGAIFILRDSRLCLDNTPWDQVLTGVLTEIPELDDTLVAWSPLTSPLFKEYSEALKILFESNEYDSVMTVTKLQHFFLNADCLPVNFQFGVWASYSQKLKPLYQMNCALWVAKKGAMIRNRFQVGDRPFFMETSLAAGTDIDTLEEFEFAQLLYAHEKNKGRV